MNCTCREARSSAVFERCPVALGRNVGHGTPILPPMDDTLHHLDAPLGWLQALAESDDDLAAGRTVPGQVVAAKNTPKPDHSHTLQGFRPAHPNPQKRARLTGQIVCYRQVRPAGITATLGNDLRQPSKLWVGGSNPPGRARLTFRVIRSTQTSGQHHPAPDRGLQPVPPGQGYPEPSRSTSSQPVVNA